MGKFRSTVLTLFLAFTALFILPKPAFAQYQVGDQFCTTSWTLWEYINTNPQTGEQTSQGFEWESEVECLPGYFLAGDPSYVPGPGIPPPEPKSCSQIAAEAPSDCDLSYISLATVNGCSVPIVGSTLIGLRDQYGDIFEAACNKHDLCYATYQSNKDSCDLQLGVDMYEMAEQTIPANEWPNVSHIVLAQAAAYAAILYANVATIPGRFFEAAQKEAKCRYYAAIYFLMKC